MGRLLLSRRKGTLGQGNHVGEGREVGISTGEATAPRVERGQKTRWRAAECVCPGPRLQGQLERRVSTWCRWERGALEISMLSKKCRSIWLEGASLVAHLVKNLLATQETQVWSLGGEDSLEKGMANHSSILAWWSRWTRGVWWVMGSQRVRHDWVTDAFTLTRAQERGLWNGERLEVMEGTDGFLATSGFQKQTQFLKLLI